MKVLVLLHPGKNSRGLLLDIAWGFERLGHDVMYFELGPYWKQGQVNSGGDSSVKQALGETIAALIEQNKIDCSVGMWCNGSLSLPVIHNPDGTMVSFFDRMAHPHLHFWWDAPHWFSGGGVHELIGTGFFSGKYQVNYINNRGTGAEMAELLGFSTVAAGPNAVNPDSFYPISDVPKEYDLVFVSGGGDPNPSAVMLDELAKDDPDIERIRRDEADRVRGQLGPLVSELEPNLQSPMQNLLEAMLEARLAQRHQPALVHLQQVVSGDRNLALAGGELIKRPLFYIRATDLLRSIEKWERPFMVAYLSRYFKCLRIGQQSYDAWGIEGDQTDFVPYEQQVQQYARAKFALNVMRWQDDCSLNSKIFEITACRCGCLQAYRNGVEELFEDGREILVFRTPAEARSRLTDALNTPGKTEAIAEAGYRRTLGQHTWAHRLREVTGLLSNLADERKKLIENRTVPPLTLPKPAARITSQGDQLAFVLCSMRSGSTLLRKVLDSHPLLFSPAESWFLLPLLALWEGRGEGEGYKPKQVAAAIQGLVPQGDFLASCRAMASELYSRIMPAQSRWLIDKTPKYLRIASILPNMFPRARFLILMRDPRGTAWSFHTWPMVKSPGLEPISRRVANDLRIQREIHQKCADRSLIVRYESLCKQPENVCREICDFFDVPFDASMIHYGQFAHHEGYGDEKSRLHHQPHCDSTERWQSDDGSEGMTIEQQLYLANECGEDLLRYFGFDSLAGLLGEQVPANAK